ncbi:MAG TPA: hypothetical protein DCO71_05725 [Gammaproteobacteria bacterium]|nr:hypothetical protein [Gammaproteobacteria bacterium]
MMVGWLRQSIQQQRHFLEKRLRQPLRDLSRRCIRVWFNDERLNAVLQDGLSSIPLCGLIYAVDVNGQQRSANISRTGTDPSFKGQNLTDRPYLITSLPFTGMVLSDVYLSRITSRPCITALQNVGPANRPFGFIAVDFELRNLPSMPVPEPESEAWRQIRGDPAIRGALFSQEHVTSPLDEKIGDVVPIIEELICARSVFHAKIHYSSSRATLWRVDKPYHYRVHVLDEILNPSVCLAYTATSYPDEAVVPRQAVRDILDRFTMLRFIDNTIYLRAASLNVINGKVGLIFSCDGTHYMKFDEFMDKGPEFWSGGSVVLCEPSLQAG